MHDRVLDMLDHALLVVDYDGKVLYRNRHAATLLKNGRASLTLARGAVSATSLGLRERLAQAIRLACLDLQSTGICETLAGTPAETWTRMMVVPVLGATPSDANRAAIWILDTESPALPSEEVLGSLFRLSRAEARLALQLLQGRSAQECARLSGVGLATIRSQLHSMFSKTGVRRQAQLVALLSTAPRLRGPGAH